MVKSPTVAVGQGAREWGIIVGVIHDVATASRFGPDQPERFLTAWYGSPDRPLAPTPAIPGVPEVVLGWSALVARWDAPVVAQNRVPADGQHDDGVALVGVENQGVWLWGVQDTEAGPAVVERENEPGEPWTPTGESLQEYLWHFLLFEAVLGARHGLAVNNATREQAERFLTGWSPVAVKAWRWPGPGHALWSRHGCLAFSCANEPPGTQVDADTYHSLFVACRDAESLTPIDRLDLEWDWDSGAAT